MDAGSRAFLGGMGMMKAGWELGSRFRKKTNRDLSWISGMCLLLLAFGIFAEDRKGILACICKLAKILAFWKILRYLRNSFRAINVWEDSIPYERKEHRNE